MNSAINLKIKLQVFSRHIGQQVWLEDLYGQDKEMKHQVGVLTGIKTDAIEIKTGDVYKWITLQDEQKDHEVKLLLKPLSGLTDNIKDIANSLPVTVFITQYYLQMGFDMPVFISPEHPLNCKYAAQIGLADYRSPEEILALNNMDEMLIQLSSFR